MMLKLYIRFTDQTDFHSKDKTPVDKGRLNLINGGREMDGKPFPSIRQAASL
jgi:hypothetical protein